MATFVLVHGAWHGGWCWDEVTPRLTAAGHTVVVPDLPGHGAGPDEPAPDEVTLDAYAGRVADAVTACGEPVVLVGHSMGGVVITQAAERVPDSVAALVYVTAFLPGDGEALLQLAEDDPGTLVLPNLMVAEDGASATLAPDAIGDAFYGDCEPAVAEAAAARLVPQPLAPFATPVSTSSERFGRVPRAYIECTEDRAISIDRQRRMHGAVGVGEVRTMTSSHSPFLAHPDELVAHLVALVPAGT
ncbi:MAG: alpha/beta fold hydrolase [Actinomycetota bacterium]|nr:alpha/beta fold hydrolase [Actinomycetota bacterium]